MFLELEWTKQTFRVLTLIPVVLLLSGCKPAAERDFMKLVEETKKKADSAKIRAAVAAVIQTNAVTPASGKRAIPSEISELPVFAQEGARIMSSGIKGPDGQLRGIVFLTGSGFGHWGLIVCPSEKDPKVFTRLHGKIIPWDNGVSFFLER